jgi:hypothetical protein
MAFLYAIPYNFSAHFFSQKWAAPGFLTKNSPKFHPQKIVVKNKSGQSPFFPQKVGKKNDQK